MELNVFHKLIIQDPRTQMLLLDYSKYLNEN